MEDKNRTLLGFGTQNAPNEPQAPADEPQPLADDEVIELDSPKRALDAIVPRTKAEPETFSRHFLGISLRRAFRLNINTDEVLPSERAHLEAQASHITDPDHQAFLAWRRSVLLLVAMMFVPLTISRFFEAFDGPHVPWGARLVLLLPAAAEGAFCIVAFDQLRRWAHWRRQRRVLFVAWVLYFVAPFLVYVYPLRTVPTPLEGVVMTAATSRGLSPEQAYMALGLKWGVLAMLALGPKVISLMPGLIRASIVTKLLFPGTTAPGWLMMMAAPFYALFAYIIVLLPYQVTGSWQFLVGNLGILLAQVFIGISGRRLTVPLTNEESNHRIHRTWLAYIGILVVSAIFMVYGLADFIRELHYGAIRVITGVLAFVSNVLLDTLIGTDLIVSAMAFFRQRGEPDPRHEQLLREAEAKLETFCA
jgi:hypothetical protein